MDTLQDYLNNALNEGNNDNVPQPQDCSDLSIDAIVATIHSIVNCRRDNGNTRNDAFYAGICKDVKDNMQRHGNKSYVALVDCGARDKAGAVETKLDDYKANVNFRITA